MKRREFLKAAALGAAAWAMPRGLEAAEAVGAAAGKGRKPNIIFILADDLGFGNVSCYGADNFKTPRLDALAKGGIRFDRCFAAPLCGPTRAQIMTGRYPFRTGMISNGSGAVLQPANEIMMPRVLKPAGYVTAQVGKWNQLPLQPGDWGFDEYLTINMGGRYWGAKGSPYSLNGKTIDVPEDKYVPDIAHDFLVDFITRHREQPFYVYYSMAHIHGPILKTPDSTATSDHYADNVAYMDKLVGKLVDELERLKLRENTLVVFIGDNGTAANFADRATVRGKRLSGQKGALLEGGSLVPMIVNWPGTTPEGKTSTDLVSLTDFFPTFAALAGAELPKGVTIDGQDLSEQIKGGKGTPREWVYLELSGEWYARDQRWKLTGSGELFDVSGTPYVEKPIPTDTMDAEAIAARKRLQDVLDKLNPAAGKQAAKAVKAAPKAAKRPRKARKKRPQRPVPASGVTETSG